MHLLDSNHSIYELLRRNCRGHKIDTFTRNIPIRVNASHVFAVIDSGPNHFYLYSAPSGIDINFHRRDSAVRNWLQRMQPEPLRHFLIMGWWLDNRSRLHNFTAQQ